jgi:hypothetical protein
MKEPNWSQRYLGYSSDGVHVWMNIGHDPAHDGPEIETIAFFKMFPEGAVERRVNSVTETETKLKFFTRRVVEYLLSKLFPVQFFRIPEDEIEHWTWLESADTSNPHRPLEYSESGARKVRGKC